MNLREAAVRGVAAALLIGGPALAAGGAHVVDDSEVGPAGACQAESWIMLGDAGVGALNLAPACTPRALSRLEAGVAMQRFWDGGDHGTTAGPTLKLNIRPARSGLGIALSANSMWSFRSGRLETGGLVLPLTAPVSDRLTLSLNAGWSYVRASSRRRAVLLGGQAELRLADEASLMVEAFGRERGQAGGQLGLRWTALGSKADVDFVLGHRVDGVSPFSFAAGLTLRQ